MNINKFYATQLHFEIICVCTGQQLDYKDKGVSIEKTDFNPLYPTKFVIHGFTQDEKELWVHQMKDALLTTVSGSLQSPDNLVSSL